MQELIENALGVTPGYVENWKQVSEQESHVELDL
jgi:hypothetical protein